MKRDLTAAALFAGVLAAGAASSGCTIDAFCFSGCGDGSFGGSAGDAGSGGAGGSVGGGGQGGGLFGGSGGSISPPVCDEDTQTDVNNCGECGRVCQLAGATPACEAGECVIDSCAPGFYDIDGDPATGCEYECDVPAPVAVEGTACDGVDNDCDGLTDAEDPDLQPPADFCNTTAGTPCENTQVTCMGTQGWVCEYPSEVETDGGQVRLLETRCDDIDGNCDGIVDEIFFDKGKPCDDGAIGVCRDSGEVVCDPDDDTQTICDLSLPPDPTPAGAEVCNGLDDDCDGSIDEGVTFDMAGFPDDASPTFLVDRWEASRPDATDTAAGINENIACTAAGVLPWTAASWNQARGACEARGPKFRLCTAAELRQLCERGGNAFPYGMSYGPDTCNGLDHDGVSGGTDDDVLLPTGSLATCVTGDGVFDLSGNATEWTSTKTGETNEMPPQDIYQLHGGSYLSPELGLSCDIDLAPRAGQKAVLGNIGFRCCADP